MKEECSCIEKQTSTSSGFWRICMIEWLLPEVWIVSFWSFDTMPTLILLAPFFKAMSYYYNKQSQNQIELILNLHAEVVSECWSIMLFIPGAAYLQKSYTRTSFWTEFSQIWRFTWAHHSEWAVNQRSAWTLVVLHDMPFPGWAENLASYPFLTVIES